MRLVRLLPLGLAVAALLAPAAASADHHEISIREVFPGSTANPGQDYVELQMYASGQGLLGGHTLSWYTAAGDLSGYGLTTNVSGAVNQSTVLIGATSPVVGVTADYTNANLTGLQPAGGAVCWNTSPVSFTDCASWGSFPNNATLPDPQSSSAPPIDDGKALRRTIAPGCSTLLESGDDTDASGTDFSQVTPAPRNNLTEPTESPCPNTTITSGPSKTTDRTPTFKYKSTAIAATFQCAVDGGAFADCPAGKMTLPKQSFGKHKFKVFSSAGGSTDPTPAIKSFKVVRKR